MQSCPLLQPPQCKNIPDSEGNLLALKYAIVHPKIPPHMPNTYLIAFSNYDRIKEFLEHPQRSTKFLRAQVDLCKNESESS